MLFLRPIGVLAATALLFALGLRAFANHSRDDWRLSALATGTILGAWFTLGAELLSAFSALNVIGVGRFVGDQPVKSCSDWHRATWAPPTIRHAWPVPAHQSRGRHSQPLGAPALLRPGHQYAVPGTAGGRRPVGQLGAVVGDGGRRQPCIYRGQAAGQLPPCPGHGCGVGRADSVWTGIGLLRRLGWSAWKPGLLIADQIPLKFSKGIEDMEDELTPG
jgi:hypothetical protein